MHIAFLSIITISLLKYHAKQPTEKKKKKQSKAKQILILETNYLKILASVPTAVCGPQVMAQSFVTLVMHGQSRY